MNWNPFKRKPRPEPTPCNALLIPADRQQEVCAAYDKMTLKNNPNFQESYWAFWNLIDEIFEYSGSWSIQFLHQTPYICQPLNEFVEDIGGPLETP